MLKVRRRVIPSIEETVESYTCDCCGAEFLRSDDQAESINIIRLGGGYCSTYPSDMMTIEIHACGTCLKSWVDTFKNKDVEVIGDLTPKEIYPTNATAPSFDGTYASESHCRIEEEMKEKYGIHADTYWKTIDGDWRILTPSVWIDDHNSVYVYAEHVQRKETWYIPEAEWAKLGPTPILA